MDARELAIRAFGIRAAATVFFLAMLVSILLAIFVLTGPGRLIGEILAGVFAIMGIILSVRARVLLHRMHGKN